MLEQGLIHQSVVPEGVHQPDLLDLVEFTPFNKNCLLETAHKLLIAHTLAVFQLW